MCLITTFKKGFIAPTDIIVYKRLDQQEDLSWETPYQRCKVILDSELIPNRDAPELIERRNHFELYGGVIHAYTKERIGENPFKAIIPKGTKFWVQDDLSRVAAEKLYISSEKAEEGDETDFSFLYHHSLDLLLKNGRRVHWSPDLNPNEVKGIFVYDSQAIGLEIYESKFSSKILQGLLDRAHNIDEAIKDFTGKERTKILREKNPHAEILEKLSEDSYIPSCGELMEALKNSLLINITRKALGLKVIDEYKRLWSSTPFGDINMWNVLPYRFYNNYYNFCWAKNYVLIFLNSK